MKSTFLRSGEGDRLFRDVGKCGFSEGQDTEGKQKMSKMEKWSWRLRSAVIVKSVLTLVRHEGERRKIFN